MTPAGNRTLTNEDGARTTYSYDAANQLTKAVDASGTTTYVFDADGNQKVVEAPNGDRTTNMWDGENRMTSVQQADGTRNTMAYEPSGLRVKLEESTGTKKFVWDNQNYLAETDENDDTQVVYTNEPRLYGNLVSQRRATDSHWYHFDAIGSTRELTDDAQSVTDTRLYDAWGVVLDQSGAQAIALGYVGQLGYFSNSTVYARRRHLSTGLGQWTSVDSFWRAGRAGMYSYVDNSPIRFVDPSGLVRRDYEVLEMTISDEDPTTYDSVIANVTVETIEDDSGCHMVYTNSGMCICQGAIDVSVKFTWTALTGGTQHLAGAGRGALPPYLSDYEIGLIYDERFYDLEWEGFVSIFNERFPRRSTISGTVPVGSIPCSGGTLSGVVYTFGEYSARLLIGNQRRDLRFDDPNVTEEEAIGAYGVFKIPFSIEYSNNPQNPFGQYDPVHEELARILEYLDTGGDVCPPFGYADIALEVLEAAKTRWMGGERERIREIVGRPFPQRPFPQWPRPTPRPIPKEGIPTIR